MKRVFLSKALVYATVVMFAASLAACNTAKNLNYFNDLPANDVVTLPPVVQEERVIEKGDQLQISISARSSEAASFFNKGANSSAPAGAADGATTPAPSTNITSYIVDINGFVEFPTLGKVKALGLTSQQLKDNLTKALTPYLKDPLVDITFTTFNVSFLGEVRSPGTKVLYMQRTTLLEGLAAAGDLPLTAKRYNVMLYRDYKGERKIYRFDLRKKEVLNNKDIFQLRHNDVIYVQARPGAVVREEVGFYSSILGLVIGVTTLGLTLANNN